MDGAHGLGGVVDSGATVDEPRGEHAAVVGLCQVASRAGVLVEVVPGAVLVRVEADGFGAARHAVPERLPDRHREGVLGERPGPLHEGAPIRGVSLLEPDGDIATGDVSCAVQDTGRRRKAGGCLPAIPAGVGVLDISAVSWLVGGSRTVDLVVVERAMALGCHVVADTLLFDDVVPDTLDKPEPAAGEGTVGLVFETGSDKKDYRGGDTVRHAAFRTGGDVRGADCVIASLPGDQHALYGQTDTGGFRAADAGPGPGAGVVVGDVGRGDGRADAGRDGGVEIDGGRGDGGGVLRGRVLAVPVFGAERDDGHIEGSIRRTQTGRERKIHEKRSRKKKRENHKIMTTYMEERQITVTSPLLPDLGELDELLKDIWRRKWITNNGHYHQELERALGEYLKVPYVSLFTNGTLPLITALQALRVTGEVITTPYSFVATTHALWWNGIKPVFVDIDPATGNMDPTKIESAITPRTTAIMPVHVYGRLCDTRGIQEVADKYGLRVIYDAAHAFGVEVDGESVLRAGDMSTLSFHATKVYNTVEGGALVMRDEQTKKRIDYLKNFGFAGETEVVAPGINSKMDEVRAAYGLLNLRQVDAAIEARRRVAVRYREALRGVEGITFFDDVPGVRHNYSYFPIFVDAEKYGMTRDALYFKMRDRGVLGRRYFYPLISAFSTYRGLESARPENLPNATRMAESVICLPMHHALTEEDVDKILEVIADRK